MQQFSLYNLNMIKTETEEENDIYAKDELERQYFCQAISSFIKTNGKNDDGLTIALNGEYGSGKTTVLKLLQKELSIKEKMTVVYYDCWKNSIFSEPLLPIIKAIIKELKPKTQLKNKAKKVCEWLV